MREIAPAKFLIQWQMKAKLAFYSQMDRIGEAFEGTFPHWKRSNLSLELRDEKTHRRLHLAFNSFFFECDSPADPDEEIRLAEKVNQEVAETLQLESYDRIEFRNVFPLEVRGDFKHVKARMERKLFHEASQMSEVLGAQIKDLAYVVDLVSDDDWDGRLQMGPMTRKQWFETVAYERDNYPAEGENSLKALHDRFPDLFIFFDYKFARNSIERAKFAEFAASANSRVMSATKGFLKYYNA